MLTKRGLSHALIVVIDVAVMNLSITSEFVESGTIGNPMRATMEKGEEAFRRLSEHTAKAVLELTKVPVTVTNREFVDRV